MPVRIRMKRVGAKNAPFFRIVVADGRSPRDGRFIEELGTYQPRRKDRNFTLDVERVTYWLSKGAQPSETVASFIKKAAKDVTAATAPVAAAPVAAAPVAAAPVAAATTPPAAAAVVTAAAPAVS